ncbi:hypothetical protein, partial [Vitiosangium sp. GDMCC 1.1324]|uniref:hypothetical protein n=1 Tax=Vitiosangium sp. (strain GDMCC 1.1324) TaxID=2138576 RepID=UPI001E42B0D6
AAHSRTNDTNHAFIDTLLRTHILRESIGLTLPVENGRAVYSYVRAEGDMQEAAAAPGPGAGASAAGALGVTLG